jgi:hypothetical protein
VVGAFQEDEVQEQISRDRPAVAKILGRCGHSLTEEGLTMPIRMEGDFITLGSARRLWPMARLGPVRVRGGRNVDRVISWCRSPGWLMNATSCLPRGLVSRSIRAVGETTPVQAVMRSADVAGVRRPGSRGECPPELCEVSYSVRDRTQLQGHVQLECPVRRLPVVA